MNIILVNNSGPKVFSKLVGRGDSAGEFNITTAAYYNISVSNLVYFTSNPSITYQASYGIYFHNGISASLVPNSSTAFTMTSLQVPSSFNTGSIPLTPNPPGTHYFIGMSCPGTSPFGSDVYTGLTETVNNTRCCVATAVQSGGLKNQLFESPAYYRSQCLDTSGPVWRVFSSRFNGCSGGGASVDAVQRRIQNTVRVSQSEYLENLAGLNVYAKPVAKYGFVNWNQGSDRAEPGRVVRNVPSHGANSTKTSVTRMRPGSCSAAGQGVDIKHGSYARYLARIKGRGPYRTQSVPVAPVEGNKTKKYGICNSYSALCI
jgi:hypothetical protein